MSEEANTIDNLEDALAALKKVRKADEAKRKKIDALEEQIEATDGKLAALTAYEALGTPDDLKARLTSGDAALKALTDNGVTPEELPSIAQEAKEAATLRRERDLTAAASALGIPLDALQEIADGRPVTTRTAKGEDGTESTEWVMGEGESAKPLSAMRTIQALRTAPADAPKPPPAPLPTGGAGSKATPKTVEQRTAEVRKEISI